MIDVIVYSREMTTEDFNKRFFFLLIDGEPAKHIDSAHFTNRYYFVIQRTPPCRQHSTTGYDGRLITIDNTHPYRYLNHDEINSNALEHLESIANGFADEAGAILYVNHDNPNIRQIALNIVKYGRESVWWQYTMNKDYRDVA